MLRALGLTDVRVAETRHGLNVRFNVAGAVLLKLDREAQGAVVSLAADTSIDGLKLHIQTRKLADDPVKGWRTVGLRRCALDQHRRKPRKQHVCLLSLLSQ